MFSALLHTMVTAGTPIVFAALGELITERVGILNLGLEGVMLIGSIAGFATASQFSNHWIGLVAAIIAGAASALPLCYVDAALVLLSCYVDAALVLLW